MTFRLMLQPLMAGLIALRAGRKDAREGRLPYFWSLLYDSGARLALLHEGWKDIVRVFILAIIMDLIYQLIVLRWCYPMEAMVVAISVAVIPYLVVRGLINRLLRSQLN
jgi:hypothetical protein